MHSDFNFGAIFYFKDKKSILVKIDSRHKNEFYWREIKFLDSQNVSRIAKILKIKEADPLAVEIVGLQGKAAFFKGKVLEFSEASIEELLNRQGYIFLNNKLMSNSVLSSMRFKTVLDFLKKGMIREAVRNKERYIGSDGEHETYTIEMYELENPDRKLNNSSYVNWVNKKLRDLKADICHK